VTDALDMWLGHWLWQRYVDRPGLVRMADLRHLAARLNLGQLSLVDEIQRRWQIDEGLVIRGSLTLAAPAPAATLNPRSADAPLTQTVASPPGIAPPVPPARAVAHWMPPADVTRVERRITASVKTIEVVRQTAVNLREVSVQHPLATPRVADPHEISVEQPLAAPRLPDRREASAQQSLADSGSVGVPRRARLGPPLMSPPDAPAANAARSLAATVATQQPRTVAPRSPSPTNPSPGGMHVAAPSLEGRVPPSAPRGPLPIAPLATPIRAGEPLPLEVRPSTNVPLAQPRADVAADLTPRVPLVTSPTTPTPAVGTPSLTPAFGTPPLPAPDPPANPPPVNLPLPVRAATDPSLPLVSPRAPHTPTQQPLEAATESRTAAQPPGVTSGAPRLPAPEPPRGRRAPPVVDVDAVVDRVLQQFSRRLAIEAERRGWSQWRS
jgi:hypothetical protein